MRFKDLLRLRSLTRKIRVRIAAGPNKGSRWSLATRSTFIKGRYEAVRCQILSDLILPGMIVWDVGAHCGYTVLLACRRVGDRGKVFAFEPNPENLWYLRSHIEWNGISNATVFPCALAGEVGEATFVLRGSGTGSLGHIDGGREISVIVRTVDEIVSTGEAVGPDFIKMDVEGAELDLLRGAIGALVTRPVRLLIATHSAQLHEQCRAFLAAQGYEVLEAGRTEEARRNGWNSVSIEPELLAFHPSDRPGEEILAKFRKT
ncbi:MAG: FkbM family methyltransferase [Fimbriimonadaceae bacterium]|nr:FkbM family methyltransferase [Fimbriimonadaceae bacterium]